MSIANVPDVINGIDLVKCYAKRTIVFSLRCMALPDVLKLRIFCQP